MPTAKTPAVIEQEPVQDELALMVIDQHKLDIIKQAERRELIRRTIALNATDDELDLFLEVCKNTGLDPFSKQIYFIKVQGRVAPMASIDGLRVVAERSGNYLGQVGPEWCGEDGVWSNVWLGKGFPFAARVGILRKGFKDPVWGVARWTSYVQTKADGSVSAMWQKMPDMMLAKAAEALALRKTFPQNLAGVYAPQEMDQAIPAAEDTDYSKKTFGNSSPEARLWFMQELAQLGITKMPELFTTLGIEQLDTNKPFGLLLTEVKTKKGNN